MASRATVSQTAFGFYRGTDEAIHNLAAIPGGVFFTTDTEKIYFDDAQGVRHSVGASGVKFIYGACADELSPNEQSGDYLVYPHSAIVTAYTEMNKPVETYSADDIIINHDGTLYRIKEVVSDGCYVEKLLVSGTGGGGGTSDNISLAFSGVIPTHIAAGQNYTITVAVNDKRRRQQATILFDFYDDMQAAQKDISYRDSYAVTMDLNNTGKGQLTINLPSSFFKSGKTSVLKTTAYVGLESSLPDTRFVTVVDVKFEPRGWVPTTVRQASTPSFNFPYQIVSNGYSESELFGQADIEAVVTIDKANDGDSLYFNLTKATDELNIYPLFEEASHGAHTLDIVATMTLQGTTAIEISENLHYEIAWNTGEDAIIIWSPFPRDGYSVPNYNIINIPFMVYNPRLSNQELNVTYYINDEEISTESLYYEPSEYHNWEIVKYNEGSNVFTIQCGESTWTTYVTITHEYGYSLEPVGGENSLLWLSAQGRTNSESPVRRATWANENKTTSNKVLKSYVNGEWVDSPVVLNGFNWYNNGWIKDASNNTALRVSNGASVFIPMTVFTGSQDRGQTYEFDFAVHNAVDYSRLITTNTVYLTYADLSKTDANGNPVYQWFDSDERKSWPYDLSKYEPEEEGNVNSYAIEIATGNRVPQENPKTGDVIVQRTVNSSTDSAFLTYYGDSRGIVLGTQEAFLALSASTLVSARYTDDVRVKVSFVVSPNEKLIYAYINGVLTSVLAFSSATYTQSFDGQPGITITSECADIDIYNIRVYDIALSHADISKNWVADAPTLGEKKKRYNEGEAILNDTKDNLSYDKVKAAGLLPIMVFKTYDFHNQIANTQDKLPYYKGNKIGANIYYYDPDNPKRCFHASNVQMNVQGTSSQGYPRRNFKFTLKTGSSAWANATEMGKLNLEPNPFRIEQWDGSEATRDVYEVEGSSKGKWDIGCGLKCKSFCIKVDYMDSSSSHNTAGAMLAGSLYNNSTSYDLRHPLVKNLGDKATAEMDAYRTTVYGFPILLFWENDAGKKEYLGRGNFNVDKSSENLFGFTDETAFPYTVTVNKTSLDDTDSSNTCEIETKVNDPANPTLTYKDVTECWELRQNQPGYSKFQDGPEGWLDTPQEDDSYYIMSTHFEQRYPEMETRDAENHDNGGNKDEWQARTIHFKNLWEWIRSTDVTSYNMFDEHRSNHTEAFADGPVYYPTLSSSYDSNLTYYNKVDANTYEPASISITKEFAVQGAYATVDLAYDPDTGKLITQAINTTQNQVVVNDHVALLKFVRRVNQLANNVDPANVDENSAVNDNNYVGEHRFIYDTTAAKWTYGTTAIDNMSTIGITLPENTTNWRLIILNFSIVANGFNTDLYEQFNYDTNRYRLAKFKNEFSKHLDRGYTFFYFLYTEFFLMYDSRQKNMMIASWGPEEEGGDYIWYPIFYDLDTQLGINNSGQIYWDYDTDATAKLEMVPALRHMPDGTDVWDVDIRGEGGTSTDSIFSGNGSVLWNNVYLCFKNDIINMYRVLRANGGFNFDTVKSYFEERSSDKWSVLMKNYDEYYKYLAPAITGYTNQSGELEKTADYYYCLQGDRSLQRQTMIRNRFNYLDSQWGAGDYTAKETKSQIKMRYNLNDKDRTSSTEYASNPAYTLTPYLSQYLSVIYDQTSSEVVKFTLGGTAKNVTIQPPTSIALKARLGVALTQQLAYIRGPQYISDLGDLSNKYLNEFVFSSAIRLRNLKVGSDAARYRNDNLTSLQIGAKGLLRSVDLSNLASLTMNPEINECYKLEVLKLLGTNIGEIPMPPGSILTTVYLPETVTQLIFERPLKLTQILTTKPEPGTTPVGLYVDNLTNLLPDFEENGTTGTRSYIDTLQLDDTKLGYNSYRLLHYLYTLKRKIQDGTLSNEAPNSKTLNISLANVDWTPYHQVTVEEAYDNTQAANYYKRQFNTYVPYTYDRLNWLNDVKDGVVYLKDTTASETYVTDLDMFDEFCLEVDTLNNPAIEWNFRPVRQGDGLTRLAPNITGAIHVKNSTPIDEAKIFAYYQKANHFPKLDITVDNLTPAKRARFIEYSPDGLLVEYYTQKYSDAVAGLSSTVSYTLDLPTRLHYLFGGWALVNETNSAVENQYTLNEWRERISQLDKSELDALKDASPKVIYDNNELSTLDLKNNSYTFMAVYYKKPYNVEYYYTNGQPAKDYEGNIITSTAYAGEPIQFTPIVPYLDDTHFVNKAMTHKFIGWTKNATPEKGEIYYTPSNGRIVTDKDIKFYAQFEDVDVRLNPLPGTDEYWDITIDDRTNTAAIGLKATSPIKHGKICIPKAVIVDGVSYPVKSIKSYYTGASNTTPTPSMFSPNGFNFNGNITHIFFEGAYTDCAITTFETGAFCGLTDLRYIELPNSLDRIGDYALAYCTKLVIDEVINVRSIGASAFRYVNIIDAIDPALTGSEPKETTLRIGNGVQSIGSYAFSSLGYKHVIVGSENAPMMGILFSNNGATSAVVPHNADIALTSLAFMFKDPPRDPQNSNEIYTSYNRLLEDVTVYVDSNIESYMMSAGEYDVNNYVFRSSGFFGATAERGYSDGTMTACSATIISV